MNEMIKAGLSYVIPELLPIISLIFRKSVRSVLVSAVASNRRTLLLDLDLSVRQGRRFSLGRRTHVKKGQVKVSALLRSWPRSTSGH